MNAGEELLAFLKALIWQNLTLCGMNMVQRFRFPLSLLGLLISVLIIHPHTQLSPWSHINHFPLCLWEKKIWGEKQRSVI